MLTVAETVGVSGTTMSWDVQDHRSGLKPAVWARGQGQVWIRNADTVFQVQIAG